jgi:hypothetical protein
VEYLTGSTQLSAIILNPPLFLIFLGQNIGFYGSGVLSIREARIRWGKGGQHPLAGGRIRRA